MPKNAEIMYVANMSKVLKVPVSEVEHFLMYKPFSDQSRWNYLLDVAQVMKFLPPPPARILDLGAGSGWTSEMLALSGYSVVGVDIASDMIELARRRVKESLDLRFEVCDYEEAIDLGQFDAVVIYDALHHAEQEARVIANAFQALRPGGVFITVEPGVGHTKTDDTRDVVTKFGTTEKDMPYRHQLELLRAAGFSTVRQYLRLSQLALENVATMAGRAMQSTHFSALDHGTRNGLTSVVVAVKGDGDGDPGVRTPTRGEQRPSRLRRAIRESARVFVHGFRNSLRVLRDGLVERDHGGG